MPLVLKMATPQQRSWCVLQLAKKVSVTAVKRAFRTQFHIEPPSRYPFTPGTRNSSRKGAFAKARVLGGPLCLMQLWTVFRLASNAAHKNQRTKRILSCSYHKQPPHFHMAVWNHMNAHLPRRWISCAGANDIVWCR
jgi:hypothetical protein